MTYKPSDKLLGVWVTRPLLSKKSAIVGFDTRLEAVVPIACGEQFIEFYSSPYAILGGSGNIDGRNGPYNWHRIHVKAVYVGWTRDGGKTFITDDDLVAEHTLSTLPEVLYKLHVPGALKPNR